MDRRDYSIWLLRYSTAVGGKDGPCPGRSPRLTNTYKLHSHVASANERVDNMIGIARRELGPVIKLPSSPALIDGATEVLFQLA